MSKHAEEENEIADDQFSSVIYAGKLTNPNFKKDKQRHLQKTNRDKEFPLPEACVVLYVGKVH